jgi:hypothetical protein
MNAIITASDGRFGDFLVKHWHKSLKDNVNLINIEVAVLDYGLKKKNAEALKSLGVKLYNCRKDGHVAAIRFRDLAVFLKKHNYDQVMFCDCADIIFQKDFSSQFRIDKGMIRVAYDELHEFLKNVDKAQFKAEYFKPIKESISGRAIVNAGVIFAPSMKLQEISEEITDMIKRKQYGPDQVALDYILHRDGFKPLDSSFNFVITTTKREFFVRDGKFFFENGDLIPIVHNAGHIDLLRPIENFGYGPKHNKVKDIVYNGLREYQKLARKINEKKRKEKKQRKPKDMA